MRKGIGLAAALFWFALPAGVLAQVNATVSGTVADATGALIPGVGITAENVNTGIVNLTVSNETGSYNFPSLQPGAYTISAELPGFQTARYQNVQLSQGQQVRLNFSLQVSQVAQTVEVISDADALLAQTTSSVGDVLPEVEVRSLPLASRNVIDLARTTPGAVGDNYGGARMSQINTTRDGLPTGDGRYLDWNGAYSATFTSPDLVEEVQVNVSSIDAAVGRGSGQVRMQTRSGSNDFHGALFYGNANSAFNAQDWFQNLVGAEKEYANRNQFGGRLGGPVVRNKAFFFVLYDGQRFVEKTEVVSTVLTAPARQGLFRYLTAGAPVNLGGASRRNGNAFANTPSVDLNGQILTSDGGVPLFLNQIDVFSDISDPNRTAIDQIWVAPQLLPRMPLPNDWTTGDGLNTAGHRWLRSQRGTDGATGNTPTTNRDHLTIRVDYQINESNRISYSMTREENWGVTGQTGLPSYPGGFFGDVRRNPDFYTASWSSTLSPTLLNEFRWGMKRDTWFGTSPVDLGCCTDGVWREEDLVDSAREALATFPTVDGGYLLHLDASGLGAYAPFGGASPRGSRSPLLQIADTLSWTMGSHSFQGGFEATFAGTDQFNHGTPQTTRPAANLGVGNTPVPGINSANFPGLNSNDYGAVQTLLSNLAGSIGSVAQQYFINSPSETEFLDYRDEFLFRKHYHQNDWAAFFKDNWRVTNNFTLNLGLRYDFYGVPYDSTGLGVRPAGGQSGLFGISGSDFGALYRPGAADGSPTVLEFAGKHSPNSNVLVWGNDWNNFAPSIGFSWNLPWFDRSTVLRGGYGVNYTGAPTFLQYSSALGSAPGSQLPISLTPPDYLDIADIVAPEANVFPLDIGGIQPFEPVPFTNRSTALQGYADDKVIPYVQNFNLSVQRELVPGLAFEVSYVGSKGTKLRGAQQLNTINIFENGILDAFNVTRAGGSAPLFDQMLNGLTLGGVTVGTNGTGSEALRRYTTTNQWIANGEVANMANWFNSTAALTGEVGGILRNSNLPENFIVVNPQFGSVVLHGNTDNSVYHSLQTQLTKRLSHGLSGQFSYTWSRNLGNSAAGNASASDTTASTRNPRNVNLQRGLVGFHRTHNFKAHGTWALPFGPNRALLGGAPGWVQRVVEGWEISSIFGWTSGAPMEFSTTRRTLDSRANVNTPDLIGALPQDFGKVTIGDGVVEYFPGLSTERAPGPDFGGHTSLAGRFTNNVVVDSAGNIILQNPAPGTTGNMALNSIVGPTSLDLDLSLSKRVQIGETTSFTIRADAINALNTPQWGNPNTDINSGNFGRITSAGGARTFSINARLDF